jgi:hypothetical protein
VSFSSEIVKAARTKYRVFRGNFTDADGVATTSVVWASAPVQAAAEILEHRLRSPGRTRKAFAQSISGVPERASLELELFNTDRALGPYLIGTASEEPALEYLGDSFYNLQGKLYAGLVLADGSTIESAITGTLYNVGSPSFDEDIVRVPMASRDEPILGRPRPCVTVRQIKEAAFSAAGSFIYLDGTAGTAPDATSWAETADNIADSLDEVVPYAYGPVPLPLIPTNGGNGGVFGLLFVSRNEIILSDARWWHVDGDTARDELRWGYSRQRSFLWATKITITLPATDGGGTVDLYVCGIGLSDLTGQSGFEDALAGKVHVRPTLTNKLSAYSVVSATPLGPSQIARAIVCDLSSGGSGGIDATSFDRAKLAFPIGGACCGLVYGTATIAELLYHLGAPWGLVFWVGLDDKLHVHAAGSFSTADVATAATDLPRIDSGDFATGPGGSGNYNEQMPRESGARGAAARRTVLRWSREQEDFYPAESLARYAPGNTALPLGEESEVEVSVAWVNPDIADRVLATLGGRLAFATRRWTLAMHDWISTYELGQMVRFSYDRSVGVGGAAGYDARLGRLVSVEDVEDEYAVAVFEDLGPAEAQRPCVYAALADWVKYDAAGTGTKLDLGSGGLSRILATDGAGAPKAIFDATFVGCHVSVPAAVDPLNRDIQYRIATIVSTSVVTVDRAFNSAETLAAVAGGAAPRYAGWCIEHSEASKTNTTYLTACDETNGQNRAGDPGYNVGAG